MFRKPKPKNNLFGNNERLSCRILYYVILFYALYTAYQIIQRVLNYYCYYCH